MKERPILFSGEMVRAILEGRKTQTRRIMAPQPDHSQLHTWRGEVVYEGEHRLWCWKDLTYENLWDAGIRDAARADLATRCPYGVPGDRLWVKETIRRVSVAGLGCAVYAADGEPTAIDTWPWKRDVLTAIHTPRGASRITLEVTDVRAQRLWEITDDDAKAEGVEPYTPPQGHISPDQRVPGPGFERCRLGDQPHRLPFADLWDRINGKRAPWSSNPWVWAITFRRVP